jgi:predicted HAD superfamily Cof-like phosphohydrolase
MTTMIDDVYAFHTKFGIPVEIVPRVPSDDRVELRFRLMLEEFHELLEAMGIEEMGRCGSEYWAIDTTKANLPEIADAIADLCYVAIGTALEFGLPLEDVWSAVQASNLAKCLPAKPGAKIAKPTGWIAPPIAEILRSHGWVP